MRELSDWLSTYTEYTENTESPLSYHEWCSLSVVAGALQRRVYLKWGLGQVIYPNLYVVLVGASGRTRKGGAIGIAKDMLRQVPGISVAPESSSGRQALILAMKRAITNFKDPADNKTKFHCAITAFSEELSVFLGQGDIAYLANLTDWYDSKDEWEYETVSRGKDSLVGLCLNLLGGTAPDWLQSMIPHEAVGGGFTSRIIFIVEEKKRRTIAEHNISDREVQLGEALVRDLERIAQLAGEITMDADARELYINWYIKYDGELTDGKPAIADTRFAGYCERRATHLRKLMILSSVSRGNSMIITAQDFMRGLSLLENAEKKMAKTFGGLGRAKNADSTELIKSYIQQIGVTTKRVILTKFYRDVDAQALLGIEQTLEGMRVIKIKLSPETGEKLYEWIGGDN